jgi:hypothetical protein
MPSGVERPIDEVEKNTTQVIDAHIPPRNENSSILPEEFQDAQPYQNTISVIQNSNENSQAVANTLPVTFTITLGGKS